MHVIPLSRGIFVQCCPSSIGNSSCSQSRLSQVLGQVNNFVLFRVFSVFQMVLVSKICNFDFFLAILTCCSHLSKTMSNIKNKLTPRQLYMFRKTIFGHFLDVKFVPLHLVERGRGKTGLKG